MLPVNGYVEVHAQPAAVSHVRRHEEAIRRGADQNVLRAIGSGAPEGEPIVVMVVDVNEDNPDLQIFEPVLVIVAMMWLLFLLYGLAVGRLADAFHPAPLASERRRTVMAVHGVLAAVAGLFLIVNVINVMGIVDGAGTCLSADQNGGCAVPAASTEAP